MSTEDDDANEGKTEPTFTRAQMAREVARQVREKVSSALAEYGDLEELKRKAADADKNASKLDKMAEQVATLTKRAEAAEIDSARARVAEELGLTAKEAKRLKGKTYEELKSDGDEFVDDMGIDVKARKAGKTEGGRKSGDDNDSNTGDDDTDSSTDNDEPKKQEPARRRRERPTEDLRSGAPMSTGGREETDPLKLVADIPRR